MMAKSLAWMRRYWPLTMTAAYLVCHALIYFVGLLWHLPPEIPKDFRQIPRGLRSDPSVLGGALFGAVFLGMRWTQLARRRILGVVIVLVALLGQGWGIYIDLRTAKSAADLGELRHDGDARISRIPEIAMRSNHGRSGRVGRIAAEFYFRMTGVAIPYREESDEVRMFQPDPKATNAWEQEVEHRRWLDLARPVFRDQGVSLRWFGYSKLFLATAAVLVSMALFWQRKTIVVADSPAKLPTPDQ